MKITWLGHSSFLLEDCKERRLLTDPFDATVGYSLYKGSADVITISHQHFDHNNIQHINPGSKIIDKVGFFNECDITIQGIPSYHDKYKGAKRGENIIFIIEMEGYKFCHLGDLGHLLDQKDIDLIGTVDVLFIPVGGNYTINGEEAAKIAKQIQSKIVIPMHYKTPQLSFYLDGVETFLTFMKNGEKVSGNSLEINDEILGENTVKIFTLN
ncbi:MBL fold metallo-hydrolase [Clostridium sp. UBA4548]|uniref:MBL fold metallo-hydrolase n=1 Tax=Clostridium sp. UBA4548 TaxID=1946361 RepID=UPI0025BD6899|nr:MBL fold metallo-hydrolase [Clostridium sp. UBA4548]